ncbi:MAG TPA: hypothetical protein VIO64_02665 [Pseudobacteroides sp.]|uniref:hypothetical protein n=1 Tax=Pseudobacteroides sp. TaxID=1968840 RepID=UPI002F93EE86
MNRTKYFFYNSISTAFYQIIVMIAGLIIPRVMLMFYGSEINGLVSSINQFVVYFNLVEAGLSGAAIYALYKPLAENDHKAINGVVAAAKKFYIQSGYIFISLTIGLAIIYPVMVKSNKISQIDIALLVLIFGINGALEFFTLAKYRVLLTADQKTYVISAASIVYIIVNTIIVVVMAIMGINIVVQRFVALLSIFLRSFILMIYVKRKYRYLLFNETPNFQCLDKRWDALYLQILGAVQTGAPVVILTIMANDLKIVSVYSIYFMVAASLNGLLSIFVNGVSASFGDVIAKGEKATLQKTYGEFEFLYYGLLSIFYSVAFVTIIPFIKIYTSGIKDINYNLPVIGFLFVLNGLLYNIKTPQGMLVIASGMFKETRMQSTIQALIIVIVGLVLTPVLGIYGVLSASILSNLYRVIDLVIYIPRKLTNLPVKSTVYRIIRIFLSVDLIILPFVVINYYISNYLTWFVLSCNVMLYSFIVVGFTGFLFDKKEVNNVLSRFKLLVK